MAAAVIAALMAMLPSVAAWTFDGHLDTVNRDINGVLVVSGWACLVGSGNTVRLDAWLGPPNLYSASCAYDKGNNLQDGDCGPHPSTRYATSGWTEADVSASGLAAQYIKARCQMIGAAKHLYRFRVRVLARALHHACV